MNTYGSKIREIINPLKGLEKSLQRNKNGLITNNELVLLIKNCNLANIIKNLMTISQREAINNLEYKDNDGDKI